MNEPSPSQALLDEVGLLTAMAYVDLNPIRASWAPGRALVFIAAIGWVSPHPYLVSLTSEVSGFNVTLAPNSGSVLK